MTELAESSFTDMLHKHEKVVRFKAFNEALELVEQLIANYQQRAEAQEPDDRNMWPQYAANMGGVVYGRLKQLRDSP